jgi:hypothetical protein
MSNISAPSFFSRSSTWLRQETFPSKANNKNANTAARWVAKQTKATNISIASGIVWLGTYLAGYFAKDSENKGFNFLIKGTRWLSGILGIVTPFVNISTKKPSIFESSQLLFNENDTDLKEKVVKAIIEDLEIPFHDLYKQSIFPSYSKEKAYREKIYSTVFELIKDPKDPLWLNTPPEKIPLGLKERIQELKRSLLSIYRAEHSICYSEDYKSNYSREVDNLLENIFISCSELSYAEAIKYDVGSTNVPMESVFCDQHEVSLWESEDKSYKENKYRAFEELSRDDKDDRFHLKKLPQYASGNGDCKIHELLIKAYEGEKRLIELSDPRGSKRALASLESILARGVTIDRNLWDEEYVFKQFEAWGSKVAEGNLDLRKIFNECTKIERENLDKCKKILEASDIGYGDINKDVSEILEMINSSIENLNCNPAANNLDGSVCRASFLISCLNELLSKKVLNGGLVAIMHLIDENNTERIATNLRKIVCNITISPETKRDLNFFLNPKKNSLPAQAAYFLQKLLPSQLPSNDEFNESNQVLQVAHRCLYANDQDMASRVVLIAGDPTISRDFRVYASRKLCVPTIELEDFNFVVKDNDVCIRDGSSEMPITEYFESLTNRSPIIISLKYFDSIVQNKATDDQQINIIRSALCEQLKKVKQLGNSIMVIVEIEGNVDYKKLKNASFDNYGYSSLVNSALEEYLYPEFISPEINPICFHGLQMKKIEEHKVEELRERRSHIEALIYYVLEVEKSKTVTSPLNYIEITLASEGLSLSQVGRAIKDIASKDLTQENIISAFEGAKS